MKKRELVRYISFLIALFCIALGLFIKERQNSQRYKFTIENWYSGSLATLNESMNDISLILEKAKYVTDGKQMSSLSAKLFAQTEIAKNSLSGLPTGTQELETVYRFLSQVGNYSLSITKTLISGEQLTSLEKSNLGLLSKTAKTISEAINESDITFNNSEYWLNTLEKKMSDAVSDDALASFLSELEENLSDYPTLIYDGPYSDHILTKEPVMTFNADSVDKDTALSVAKSAVTDKAISLEYDGMEEGKIECYRFGNDDVTVTVSKNGGYVVYIRKSRGVGDTFLTYNKALSAAKKYMSDMGYENMIETYYYTDEGVCVINFAFLDGKTICYTDLIKVGVAMDTGEIMLFETSGYLNNHTLRAFETPLNGEDKAMEKISEELTVKSSAMALIPTDKGSEVRCYEFLCSNEENDEFLVYINPITLECEQMFFLMHTDGGTLTK